MRVLWLMAPPGLDGQPTRWAAKAQPGRAKTRMRISPPKRTFPRERAAGQESRATFDKESPYPIHPESRDQGSPLLGRGEPPVDHEDQAPWNRVQAHPMIGQPPESSGLSWGSNTSSILKSNAFASLKARDRDGSCLLFSTAFTACRETPTCSPRSAWLHRRSARRTRSRFFIWSATSESRRWRHRLRSMLAAPRSSRSAAR